MAPFKGTAFVCYHRTWSYLADWLGLQPVEFIEPKPGIPPNPTHVVHVLGVVRQRKVPLILQESFYPDNASRIIAEKTGAKLLKLSGGTRFQSGQGYVEHMDEWVTELQKTLSSGGTR
jgi:zinc/manganese transport system substrate-binding protein